jgi:hypothetical protein
MTASAAAGGRGVAGAVGGCGLLELAGELIVGASQGVQHWARITGEPW